MYGIGDTSIIPVRSEPNERSEMVTQVLFGELYSILDEMNGWVLICCHFDNYEGWIDKKMSRAISGEFGEKVKKSPAFQLRDIVGKARKADDGSILHLVKGSILPLLKKNTFELDGNKYTLEGLTARVPEAPSPEMLINEAMQMLNVPYLWGGRTPFGIDCSGFTQMVFRACGYVLSRDASQQVNSGETVSFFPEAIPGDLAFFDNAAGSITHVGMILGDGKIIHASGRVRIDNIDHYGIYNAEAKKYSHNLRIIRRINS